MFPEAVRSVSRTLVSYPPVFPLYSHLIFGAGTKPHTAPAWLFLFWRANLQANLCATLTSKTFFCHSSCFSSSSKKPLTNAGFCGEGSLCFYGLLCSGNRAMQLKPDQWWSNLLLGQPLAVLRTCEFSAFLPFKWPVFWLLLLLICRQTVAKARDCLLPLEPSLHCAIM